tara:strand:+ start:724 stop:2568 length:1845 start_codon:yes stop_codon:yes gene_type:complete
MTTQQKPKEAVDTVVIRFAGDSGDGMQLTGNQFSENTAIFGNDLTTLPDYPAEIRAPAGSLFGVSSFQLKFSKDAVHTPGDDPDVLVAMNPAAFKVHLKELKKGGTLIVNTANFTPKNLKLAEFESNPLEDSDDLSEYRVIKIDMTQMVYNALEDMGLTSKIMARSTNMFALGLLYWLYDRDMQSSLDHFKVKFKSKPEIIEANTRALKAGFYYGETIEAIKTTYTVAKADFDKGTYRNIMGNQALALGLLAASEKSGLDLFFGGYPITPASEILHYLANYKNFGVKTFQAEDEIAGICSVLGAAFCGDLAVTASSGPGIALKGEAMGLGVITELPIVIVNIQRGGPSTGLPTKTEQSDLMQAMYGRNGEAPIAIVAAQSPSDCFNAAFEACKMALENMTPVVLLSDGYIANGSEPWKIPDYNMLPDINTRKVNDVDGFSPYDHSNDNLSRPWATPGTAGLEHRIGGLEKWDNSGNISYDPENHDYMVKLRQKKVDVIADSLEEIQIFGEGNGELLVLGWGGTYGAIRSAVQRSKVEGKSVSHIHLRNLNPLPKDLGEKLEKYDNILIPELNSGQLNSIIRSKYLIDTKTLNKVEGKPFTPSEIYSSINQNIKG